jgi:quinol monooxygenase YgiN
MLIIAGSFEVDPARRDEFIAGREDAMRRSRAEPGCHAYVLSADPLEPGRVCLFERWEGKEELKGHLDAMRTAPRVADGIEVLASEIVQYEIGAVGRVGS